MEKHLDLPPVMKAMGGIFLKNGFTLYIVGGYVRNRLLGLPVTDSDICSGATPSEAAAFLRLEGMHIVEKAPEFGTIEIHAVFDGKKHIFEHTTFRSDIYGAGGSHRPEHVDFTGDILPDAVRRDFTVNALYLNACTGEVLDVLGRGLSDLERRRIGAAHENPFVTLRDDGLRLMRLVRLASELGFDIDEGLYDAAKENSALLKGISKERIQAELKKIMLADTKYPHAEPSGFPHKKGMLLLDSLGLLSYILPSLTACKGVLQNKKYHAFDVFMHCIESFAVAGPDLATRLAALLHDVGKPLSLFSQGNMYGHEKAGAELVRSELDSLRFDAKTVKTVVLLVQNHMFDLDNKAKPDTVRRRVAKLGTEVFKKLIEVRRADFIGSGVEINAVDSADKWQRELDRMTAENAPLNVNDLVLSGSEIMRELGIPAGPVIGRIKEGLFRICLQKPSQNNRQNLLFHARQLYGSIKGTSEK